MQCSRGYFKEVPALAVAAIAMLAPVVLQAQGRRLPEREDPVLRADCRLAAQAIETGRPSPHWGWAMETISACDETAGDALAKLWRSVPTDSIVLMRLLRSAREIKDQRVYVAATTVARDASAAWWPRATALRLLAAYVDPGLRFHTEDLRPGPDSAGLVIRTVSHWVQNDGSQPLAAGAIPEIQALLAELAASDPNPDVRYTAQHLHFFIKK